MARLPLARLFRRRASLPVQLPPGCQYRAFISYRSADRRWASWLHKKLEHYSVPSRLVGLKGAHGDVPVHLKEVFLDRASAAAASDVERTFGDELARAQHLVVLCSPEAAEPTSWVGREIEMFRERRPEGPIHAVVVRGDPPACFPEQLRTLTMSGSVAQPLAADLRSPRQGGDGTTKGRIKLIAAILGVRFDALWQREKRRRVRRAAIGVAVVGTILAGLAGLLVQNERSRLAALYRVAQTVDRRANPDLSDLLTIAAGPPVGSLLSPESAQAASLRAIGRRYRPSFAGFAPKLHDDINPNLVAVSSDGSLLFSTDRSDPSLMVWSMSTGELSSRLPMDAADWLAPRDATSLDRTPLAIGVRADGRVVVAVYHVGRTTRSRTLAVWRVTEQGRCDGLCLPEVFRVELSEGNGQPDATPLQTFRRDSAKAIVIDDDVLYFEPSRRPMRISLREHKLFTSAPLESGGASTCSPIALAGPPPVAPDPGALSFPSLGVSPSDNGEIGIAHDGRNGVAIVSAAGTAMNFYRSDREITRLILPRPVACSSGRCDFEAVFLEGGSRALIADDDGRVYGVMSLDDCRFERWPSSVSPKDPLLPFAGVHAKEHVHRVQGLASSTDSQHVAARLTVSGGAYRDLVAILGIKEQRMVALYTPPEGSNVLSIDKHTSGAGFVVNLSDGTVPIRPDGSAAGALRSVKGLVLSGQWHTQLAWHALRDNAEYQSTIRTINPVSMTHSREVPFFGGGIQAVAVSTDGRLFAWAQNELVVLQRAEVASLSSARRWFGVVVQSLSFSPDGRYLAGSVHAPSSDRNASLPPAIYVWRTADGGEVAKHRPDKRTSLVGIMNDGTALLEDSDGLALLTLSNLGMTRIPNTSGGRFRGRVSGSRLIVADERAGKLYALETDAQLSELGASRELQMKRFNAVSVDEAVAYYSDRDGDYLFDIKRRAFRQFLRSTPTEGLASIGADHLLAVAVRRSVGSEEGTEIQLWNATNSAPIERFGGAWGNRTGETIAAAWFKDETHELWALDNSGRLHRWSRLSRYEQDLLQACADRQAVGARMALTDLEFFDHRDLRRQDLIPCHRAGLLSLAFWQRLLGGGVGR